MVHAGLRFSILQIVVLESAKIITWTVLRPRVTDFRIKLVLFRNNCSRFEIEANINFHHVPQPRLTGGVEATSRAEDWKTPDARETKDRISCGIISEQSVLQMTFQPKAGNIFPSETNHYSSTEAAIRSLPLSHYRTQKSPGCKSNIKGATKAGHKALVGRRYYPTAHLTFMWSVMFVVIGLRPRW